MTLQSLGSKPKLLDQVRAAIRIRHYSRRTEKAYVYWIRRFVIFHRMRHPTEMGEVEVTEFLSSLATRDKISASTQNQALAAILFLYKRVLNQELEWMEGIVRAKMPQRLPVVLCREEVQAVLGQLQGVRRLMATLLYGGGLRILSACGFGSKTSTSVRISSSSGTARGERTGRRCCRSRRSAICRNNSGR